jgi:protein-S-isoprenylcysteine O-methyltransferase Ste14
VLAAEAYLGIIYGTFQINYHEDDETLLKEMKKAYRDYQKKVYGKVKRGLLYG